MAEGLIFPVLTLAFLGWLVPRLLSRVWPEGLRPLMALAAVSVVIMLALGAAVFMGLYVVGGVPLSALWALGPGEALRHFGWLALISGLVWGPILILSVAGLPQYWVDETW